MRVGHTGLRAVYAPDVRPCLYGAIVSVLEEQSPYCFHAYSWSMWRSVVEVLRRYEETGIPQPELPRSIQRPGALVALTIGLAVRQAALAAEASSRATV